MARIQIMEFKQDGDTIRVYTGEKSADVYYSINKGNSKSTGLRWNDNNGVFTRGGSLIEFNDGKTLIRQMISE